MRKLIENLPEDVLSRVFLLIVQDEAYHAPDKRPRYPWTVASICTRWRNVCLKYRLLWCYINFSWHSCSRYGRWDQEREEYPSLEQIQLQLARSGTAPLVIHAGMLCDCERQRLIWRAVMPHSGRWEEVQFGYGEGEEGKFTKLIQEGQNTGFAKLRHILFQTDSSESEAYPSPLPGYNSTLTSLRSLTLVYVSRLYGLEDFPWEQLTRLNLKPYTGLFTDLLETLSTCKNLTHLGVSLDEDWYGMEVDDISKEVKKESVIIPGLLELSLGDVRGCGPAFVKNILPFLRLPSLLSLKVDSSSSRKLLLDFLQRSTTITELNIEFAEEGDENEAYEGEDDEKAEADAETTEGRPTSYLSNLLHNVPQLRTLTFDGPIPTLISTLLEKRSDTTYLCPSLQQLKMHFDLLSDPEFNWGTLVEMVKSRRGMKPEGASLKTLCIIYPSTGDVEDSESDEEEANEGADEEDPALESARARLRGALKDYTDNGLELYFVPSRNDSSETEY